MPVLSSLCCELLSSSPCHVYSSYLPIVVLFSVVAETHNSS